MSFVTQATHPGIFIRFSWLS